MSTKKQKQPKGGKNAAPSTLGTSFAILDGDRLIEENGSGKLAIYYSYADAAYAFPFVKKGADEAMKAGLRICPVEISKAR